MGKASSAKKVARAARAGGSRRSGQRRALGFPITVFLVVALGLSLVFVARSERITNATPKVGEHIHAAYSIYTCVPETTPADGSTTTTTAPTSTTAAATSVPTDSTTTTAGGPSTTVAAPGDVTGQFQAPLADATTDALGIHTHQDGVIHIHPFVSAAAGRNATLGVFFDQVALQISDTKLTLPNGQVFEEGVTKCQGGKDGIVEIAQWSSATDAANGARPNAVFTSGFRNIRLQNRQAYTIAFLPAGQQIPIEKTISSRLDTLGDVDNSQVPTSTTAAVTVDSSTTTAPAASDGSTTTAPTGSTTSAPPSGSSSSSSSP
jgi:hypothetical protein